MKCKECGEIMEVEKMGFICGFCDGTAVNKYGKRCTCDKGTEYINLYTCPDCGHEENDIN